MSESTDIPTKLIANLPSGTVFNQMKPQSADDGSMALMAMLQTGEKRYPTFIEYKNTSGTAAFREAAREAKEQAIKQGAAPFVASQFIGQRLRQVAKEEQVGYVDWAGNFYFRSGDVYVEKVVDKNPYSQKNPLKNLFAPISSRIIRALLIEPDRQWILSQLATETDVSLGQTHKVIAKLTSEELVTRNEADKIVLTDPKTLLEEWKAMYRTYEQNKRSYYMYGSDSTQPLSVFLKQVGERDVSYALGFFTGAQFVAPFLTSVPKIQTYVPSEGERERIQQLLNLQEVESGGNVELYIPYDSGVFYKTQTIKRQDGQPCTVVSNVQLYMDLVHNPARGAEQAEHIRELTFSF